MRSTYRHSVVVAIAGVLIGLVGPVATGVTHAGETPEWEAREDVYERYWGWDFNLDLAAARHRGNWGAAASMRTGIKRVDEPWVWTLGPTLEAATGMPTRVGVEAEMTSLYLGVYGQLGAGVDRAGLPVATGAVGWSVMGVETQYRPGLEPTDQSNWAWLAKFRVPVSWIVEAARR